MKNRVTINKNVIKNYHLKRSGIVVPYKLSSKKSRLESNNIRSRVRIEVIKNENIYSQLYNQEKIEIDNIVKSLK